jgi:hypothetical protein
LEITPNEEGVKTSSSAFDNNSVKKSCSSQEEGQRGRALLATPMRKSIGCDEGRFTSPEECASAPTFRFTKECRWAREAEGDIHSQLILFHI